MARQVVCLVDDGGAGLHDLQRDIARRAQRLLDGSGHLVFGVTGHDVVTTVANGRVLMKDRRLTQIDEAKVMADCRQAAAELASRINSR